MKKSLLYAIIELIAGPIVHLLVKKLFIHMYGKLLLYINSSELVTKLNIQYETKKRSVNDKPKLILLFVPKNNELFKYLLINISTPKNPVIANILKLTANSVNLKNYGLKAAMGLTDGLLILTVLLDPAAEFIFNKNFSEILKRTDEKLKHKNG